MVHVLRLDMTIKKTVHRRDSETNRIIADVSDAVGIRNHDQVMVTKYCLRDNISKTIWKVVMASYDSIRFFSVILLQFTFKAFFTDDVRHAK
jgi:hypothetical protein